MLVALRLFSVDCLMVVEIPDSTGGEISLSADEREPPKVEDL